VRSRSPGPPPSGRPWRVSRARESQWAWRSQFGADAGLESGRRIERDARGVVVLEILVMQRQGLDQDLVVRRIDARDVQTFWNGVDDVPVVDRQMLLVEQRDHEVGRLVLELL